MHIEDAADAIVAGLGADPGVYNIVDDAAIRQPTMAGICTLGGGCPLVESADDAIRSVGAEGTRVLD